MDRRKYLKTLAVGSLGASALIACEPGTKEAVKAPKTFTIDRTKEELIREEKLLSETFFDEHEMKTIGILADIIIPKDGTSGSATDAGVPAFIEFIVKDMPEHQVPMRGGLRWLDIQCLKRFERSFKDCDQHQQLQVVDEIAYPEINYEDEKGNPVKKGNVKADMQAGASFFSLMRNLTATGFYTSPIGVQDIGYAGNKATQWNGVPDEVLKQYNVAYTDKELKECVSFEKKQSV